MQIRQMRVAALVFGGLLAIGVWAPRTASADMDLNIEKLSSNGMEVRKLSCQLQSGGLLGSVLIIGELAKHKKAFDACAPRGAAFATKFTWKDGKTANAQVTAASDKNGNDCVIKALKATKAAVEGTCTAILLTGNTAVAEAAAAKLGT